MKKSRVYTRKRLALRWTLLALVFLLMVNQLLGICLLLPIQAAHRSADLQGIGRTHPVERRWEPELRATGLLYLMANENALSMTATHFGPLGWETERGSAVDCTGDAPLYVGQYEAIYEDRMVNCYFGRIDDLAVELIELKIRAEPFDQANPEFYCLTVEREAFIKQEDHTFFWIMEVLPRKRNPEWVYEYPIILAYDARGNVVTEFDTISNT